MDFNKIYQGNCLDTLKTFDDEIVNCCITSPPYYGLRDYGTGKWVGGDPNCKHLRKSKLAPNANTGHKRMSIENSAVGDGIYKSVCNDCGAVREDMQVGLEETPEEYIARLVDIFNEVKCVLTKDGTCWVNIGDTYNVSSYVKNEYTNKMNYKQATNRRSYENGVERARAANCKPKDLIGIPWMLAFALRDAGWYLRQDIIWHKPNPMPESVKDRFTKSHEYIFLLSKSQNYYFDHNAMQESAKSANPNSASRYKSPFFTNQKEIVGGRPGNVSNTPGMKKYTGKRNKRDVWSVVPAHYKESHFATFPEELVYPMLIAGCPKGGVVLDPFMGSGTVGVVAKRNHRQYVGCELNDEYVDMAEQRIKGTIRRLF